MSSVHLLYMYCFGCVCCWLFWQDMKAVNGERNIMSRIIEAIEKCE